MIFYNASIFKKFGEEVKCGFISAKNGLIESVDDMVNFVDYGDEKLDCSGLKILPGFVDAHCHVGMWENGLNFEGSDGNEETDPVCAHLRAIDGVNPQDDAFLDALKAGVTTIVTGPGSANPVGGSFISMKTFGQCVDDMILKNPVGIKFALGENPKSVYNDKGEFPTTRMAIASLIRENLEKTRRYVKRLEIARGDISLEPDYDIKLESLKSLFDSNLRAFFHCHRADDIFTAIRIANEFSLKLVLVHATEGYLIKNKLSNVEIISGPLVCDRLKPELKFHNAKGVVDLFYSGVKMAVCTDHPVVPIDYFLQSCAVLVKHGLKTEEVLKMITQNAAEICGIFDKVGSIEKGKFANFVAFKIEDDIFSNYVEPVFVVVDGKVVVKNQDLKIKNIKNY